MKKPDWFALIEQWRVKNMGQNGITLPFLVGALAYKSGKKELNESDIREVLYEIIHNPVDGYVIQVYWCHNISAPVLTSAMVSCPERIQSFRVSFPRPSGGGESLVFGNFDIHWGAGDCSEWLNCLVEDSKFPVLKGKFSRNRKGGSADFNYGDFTTAELDYIQSTIGPPLTGGC